MPNNLYFSENILSHHCLLVAADGVEKRNFLALLLKQHISRGGGIVYLSRGGGLPLMSFLTLARSHHRWHDIRVLNLDEDEISNSYSPFLRGDAAQLTARALLLGSLRAERALSAQATQGFRAMVGMLLAKGLPLTFEGLNLLLNRHDLQHKMRDSVHKDTREYKAIEAFLGVLRSTAQASPLEELRRVIEHYCHGTFHDVLNSANPDIDMLSVLQDNQLLYANLSQPRGAAFARAMVADVQGALAQLQALPSGERPCPPVLLVLDGFVDYAFPSLVPLFEQAHHANISLLPIVADAAALSADEHGLDREFAHKVLGNTWNKIILGAEQPELPPDDEAAEDDDQIPPAVENSLAPGEALYVERGAAPARLRLPRVVLPDDGEGGYFPRFA